MQNYQPMQTYSPYQPMMQPYADRLSQLQNYQQSINQPIPAQTPQVNQGLLWVQGEAGAKSYLVAPNTTVLLMDSESSKFYLKSTDGSGMPNLRTFEYTEVSQNVSSTSQSEEIDLSGKYVTREEYEGLKSQYKSILERLDNLSSSTENEPSAKPRPRGRGGNSNEQSDI